MHKAQLRVEWRSQGRGAGYPVEWEVLGMWVLQHVGTQCQPEPCTKSDSAELAGDKALISMGVNLPIINERCCSYLLHKGSRDVSWGFLFGRYF